MIPVLIVPVINHPEMLDRMLRSLDHPVETLVLIDNSADLEMGDVAEAALPNCVETLVVVEPPRNLGVSGSINLGIKSYPESPWWMVSNADLRYGFGDLDTLVRSVEQHPDGVSRLCEWAAYGTTQSVVGRVGFYDESFFPIYFDDTDYHYRCRLVGVPVIDLTSNVVHEESVSYRGNYHEADNARTFPENARYYVEKWGGPRGSERFTHPFGDPGLPVDYTRLDLGRLARQRWAP